MKKQIPFIVFTLFLGLAVSAQNPCLPDGIYFSTQAEIDNFQSNYPGCTEIQGDLEIAGPDITNFNGLNPLTSIGGTLVFINNSSLTSLSGLENLSNIGGNLEVDDNNALTNLSGLEGLTTVSGTVQIRYNDVLSDLSGLVNLSSVGGNLWIWDNAFTTLTGLENLISIGGYLGIEQNSELIDLNGVDNIDPVTITGLRIINNPVLSTCDVKSVCDYLASGSTEIEIYGNSGGCHHSAEILELCAFNIIEHGNKLPPLTVYPNPSDKDVITITIDKSQTNQYLTCYNSIGKTVYNQVVNENETVIDITLWQPGIYLAILYEDGKPAGKAKFVVQ